MVLSGRRGNKQSCFDGLRTKLFCALSFLFSWLDYLIEDWDKFNYDD